MTAIVIGVMPQEKIRERVLSIARGSYKPKPGEAKIWFTSMKSLAEVLSDDNRALLQAIREANPESRLPEYLVLISLVEYALIHDYDSHPEEHGHHTGGGGPPVRHQTGLEARLAAGGGQGRNRGAGHPSP